MTPTRASTRGYAAIVIKEVKSGKVFDLSTDDDGTLLKNEILTGEWKIISGKPEWLIVVEKASIFSLMIQLGWAKEMNAIIICCKGFPRLTDRAWVYSFRMMFNIDQKNCIGICDYGPYGYTLINSFLHAKDPIEKENVYQTRLALAITPAFIGANFPETLQGIINGTRTAELDEADYKIIKFLVDKSNRFFETNDGVRMAQLRELVERGFKLDLDAIPIIRLLDALRDAIRNNKVI